MRDGTQEYNISTRLPVQVKSGGDKTTLATYMYMHNLVLKEINLLKVGVFKKLWKFISINH